MKRILLISFLLGTQACYLPYVIKQGYYQAQLLCGRKPIARVLREGDSTQEQRDKLNLILDVRQFVKNHVGLTPGKNYTTVNMDWDREVWTVSASAPLEFHPYTWTFPIVGAVPYKGFFDKDDAKAERDRLLAAGYDVQVRPVDGYSTLGYFNDPVWKKTLDRPDRSLVELISHELAHRTLFFSGQSEFNESYANFVGKTATLQYFAAKFGEKSQARHDAAIYFEDEIRYQTWMWKLYQRLEHLYKSQRSKEEKLKEKKVILDHAPADFKKVGFKSEPFKKAKLQPMNNATLMSFKQYNSHQKELADLLRFCGGDWRKFLNVLRPLHAEKEPGKAFEKLLKEKGTQICG